MPAALPSTDEAQVLDLSDGRKRLRRERAPYIAGLMVFLTIAAVLGAIRVFEIVDPYAVYFDYEAGLGLPLILVLMIVVFFRFPDVTNYIVRVTLDPTGVELGPRRGPPRRLAWQDHSWCLRIDDLSANVSAMVTLLVGPPAVFRLSLLSAPSLLGGLSPPQYGQLIAVAARHGWTVRQYHYAHAGGRSYFTSERTDISWPSR